jgi:3-oxoacyl-[acyl-carrier-protein] synthase-1
LALAAPALCELFADARRRKVAVGSRGELLPLVLALPEAGREDDAPDLDGAILAELVVASGAPVDLTSSEVVRLGHAGFAAAVTKAMGKLERGASAVVVGGVDSWLHPEVIGALDREHRLHSLTEDDAFIPSEGAAFVLLAPAKHEGLARLTHAATGEEATVRSGEPNLSAALRRLVRAAAASSAGEPVRWVLTDLNGERARTNEWIPIDSLECIHEDFVHDRGPIGLGDLGAASGAVLLVIACIFFEIGWAPAPAALVVLASDGPTRGVIRVEGWPS